MAAAGLQRSSVSFRRQGSSGLVWDDKFLNMNQIESRDESSDGNVDWPKDEDEIGRRSELRQSWSTGSISMMQGSRSNGSQQKITSSHRDRAIKVPLTTIDPPSPRVRGCGFFGIFSKPVASPTSRTHSHKARKNSTSKKR